MFKHRWDTYHRQRDRGILTIPHHTSSYNLTDNTSAAHKYLNDTIGRLTITGNTLGHGLCISTTFHHVGNDSLFVVLI